ncbi:MAG TPA: iron-containing alcohol dehydrogenase [Bryobacteraceae bacterium]|nr:iron-containing alcohol dehydrogenase [Bryobacteraceae bacterium]
MNFDLRTRVLFGESRFAELGGLARGLGFTRTLVVSDPGIAASGYPARALALLTEAGVEASLFSGFSANPDTEMVEAGRISAAAHHIDSLVALGGGSSLDCAKGINFLVTNGGHMRDYWGFGKASRPMLPMIGIPTTAGTGSEAQSYALISDAATHVKMACGDPKAAFRAAILDPLLTRSQPREVTATAGYDAISHAVESYVTTRRTTASVAFAREAWRLLSAHFERVLRDPGDLEARGAMLLGANYAGTAIENSMLGATHACANPLTAHYGTTHGMAIAALLPHVVRWNWSVAAILYADLADSDLADRLAQMAEWARLPSRLRDLGVPEEDLPTLAEEAAAQWTGRFNPRPFDAAAANEIYIAAY